MRVRILESLAWGMPIVTTTIGLEGIEAKVGEEVLVADEPKRHGISEYCAICTKCAEACPPKALPISGRL